MLSSNKYFVRTVLPSKSPRLRALRYPSITLALSSRPFGFALQEPFASGRVVTKTRSSPGIQGQGAGSHGAFLPTLLENLTRTMWLKTPNPRLMPLSARK